MKIPCIICLAALAFLTACQSEADKAKDRDWIAKRAAYLKKEINPETGRKYTLQEATKAATDENNFGSASAYYAFTHNEGMLKKTEIPITLLAHPSAQPGDASIATPAHHH